MEKGVTSGQRREMGKGATRQRERNGKGGHYWTKREKWKRGSLLDKEREMGKGAPTVVDKDRDVDKDREIGKGATSGQGREGSFREFKINESGK